MKEYYFIVTGLPDSAFHQPFDATLTLSDAAVVSGVASASDILSIQITAGEALPDSDPITLADLAFINPKITLSPDRKSVTAFSADSSNGGTFDFFLLFRTFHPTPAGVVENVIRLRFDGIEVETDYIPPAQPEVYDSKFVGSWLDYKEDSPRGIKDVFELAIDPWALLLPNDIYVRLHLPDPPPYEIVQESIRERINGMSIEERERAHARIKKMKAFTDDLEREFEKQKR